MVRRLQYPAAMNRGFSLIEVLVATTLTTVATVGLAQLAVMSVRLNHTARSSSLASALASRKMEQLRALAWTLDAAGNPVSDVATDTAVDPESPSGGTGLTPSPPDALTQDTAGYCDYVDGAGRVLRGPPAPAGAEFVRRWSIESLVLNETLIVQVSVTRIDARVRSRRASGETRLADVRTRRAP